MHTLSCQLKKFNRVFIFLLLPYVFLFLSTNVDAGIETRGGKGVDKNKAEVIGKVATKKTKAKKKLGPKTAKRPVVRNKNKTTTSRRRGRADKVAVNSSEEASKQQGRNKANQEGGHNVQVTELGNETMMTFRRYTDKLVQAIKDKGKDEEKNDQMAGNTHESLQLGTSTALMQGAGSGIEPSSSSSLQAGQKHEADEGTNNAATHQVSSDNQSVSNSGLKENGEFVASVAGNGNERTREATALSLQEEGAEPQQHVLSVDSGKIRSPRHNDLGRLYNLGIEKGVVAGAADALLKVCGHEGLDKVGIIPLQDGTGLYPKSAVINEFLENIINMGEENKIRDESCKGNNWEWDWFVSENSLGHSFSLIKEGGDKELEEYMVPLHTLSLFLKKQQALALKKSTFYQFLEAKLEDEQLNEKERLFLASMKAHIDDKSVLHGQNGYFYYYCDERSGMFGVSGRHYGRFDGEKAKPQCFRCWSIPYYVKVFDFGKNNGTFQLYRSSFEVGRHVWARYYTAPSLLAFLSSITPSKKKCAIGLGMAVSAVGIGVYFGAKDALIGLMWRVAGNANDVGNIAANISNTTVPAGP